VVVSLDLLRTFLVVYREGSITRASRQLQLSQPAVTGQVKALEATLGRPLFTRLPRGVESTLAADTLARQIAAPLDQLEMLTSSALGRDMDVFTRVVQLGGPAELTTARVLPAVSDLVSQGLQLRVTLSLVDQLISDLVAGKLDMAIATVRPRRRGLRVEPLCDEEFILVGTPSWAQRLPATVIDRDGARALADVPLISYAEELPIIRRYWQTVFGVRPTSNAAVVVPDLRGVLATVLAGAGVSVLPRYLCAGELDRGVLTALHTPSDLPLNTLFLVTRPTALSNPAVAALHARLLLEGRLW
jgi:DNA-binding transcriptional LysR family regulator